MEKHRAALHDVGYLSEVFAWFSDCMTSRLYHSIIMSITVFTVDTQPQQRTLPSLINLVTTCNIIYLIIHNFKG